MKACWLGLKPADVFKSTPQPWRAILAAFMAHRRSSLAGQLLIDPVVALRDGVARAPVIRCVARSRIGD
ncbi:MAG: hypothetical protein QM757_46120 [Paludibaculum sp.]